jgi:hypothetical protein
MAFVMRGRRPDRENFTYEEVARRAGTKGLAAAPATPL